MKICSLLPSATEILFDLGLGDQIVGVSDICDYPAEARAKTVVCRSKVDPSVLSSDEVEELMQQLLDSGESPYVLDQEWLWQQSPDVILIQDLCYVCEVDAAAVGSAVQDMPHPPKVVVLQPKDLTQIFDSIVEVGDACGAVGQAKALATFMERRVRAVQDTLASVTDRPRVFSLEGINPIVVGGHWIPDLLRLAGGDQKLYPPGCPAARVGWEEIRDYAPEKLFLDLCSSDLARNRREVPWLAAQDGWSTLSAVQSGEVYLIDHVYFSRPGPRVVQGLEILAQLTHPALFDGMVPADTVAKLDPQEAAGCPAEEIARCFHPYPATGN